MALRTHRATSAQETTLTSLTCISGLDTIILMTSSNQPRAPSGDRESREVEPQEPGAIELPGKAAPSEIAEPAARYRFEAPPYSEHVAWLVGQELDRLEARYAERGRSLAELGPPQEVAERMVASLPSPSRWDKLLGPFYGPSQVAKVLGNISRQAVAERRQRRTLLGLRTADRRWVYPLFQFDRRNRVLAGLPEVLRILADSGIDDWSLAGWLMSPLRSLAGRTAVEWLRDGRDSTTLLDVTRDAAHRFAQ